MSRKTGTFRTGETTELRAIAGAITADSGTLSDANFPAAGGIDCSGFDTVLVGVEIVAGSSPTMTIEALFYDPEAAVDAKWSRVLLGAAPGVTLGALGAETTGALASGSQYAELRVFGHSKVYFRVTAVTNAGSTTSSKILGRPGRVRGDRRLNLQSSAIA